MSKFVPATPEDCPTPYLHGDNGGPFRYCPNCTWIEPAQQTDGTDETVEVLLPLVTYLMDHHTDRYGGNHCIDVAVALLREADARLAAAQADTAERIAEAIEAEMVEDRAVGRVTVGGVTPWERCAALARSVGVPETELK